MPRDCRLHRRRSNNHANLTCRSHEKTNRFCRKSTSALAQGARKSGLRAHRPPSHENERDMNVQMRAFQSRDSVRLYSTNNAILLQTHGCRSGPWWRWWREAVETLMTVMMGGMIITMTALSIASQRPLMASHINT